MLFGLRLLGLLSCLGDRFRSGLDSLGHGLDNLLGHLAGFLGVLGHLGSDTLARRLDFVAQLVVVLGEGRLQVVDTSCTRAAATEPLPGPWRLLRRTTTSWPRTAAL